MDIGTTKKSSVLVHTHIPQEIIEEIIAKLPVKSLLRFKCVSKLWRCLIDDHLQISRRRVVFNAFSMVNDLCWPDIDDRIKGGCVVGCSNGVLCINKKGRFFLWNPATRVSIKLPESHIIGYSCEYGWENIRCGFGWDEETDAYKVFVCTNDNGDESVAKVYSSKTNSWKQVECGRLQICGPPDDDFFNVGVLARGKLYWMPEKKHGGYVKYMINSKCIEYFDLKNEVFGKIEVPCELREDDDVNGWWWLRERDGCLYAIFNYNNEYDYKGRGYNVDYKESGILIRNRGRGIRRRGRGRGRGRFEFDVWVMEKYGVKNWDIWVKKKSIASIPNSILDYQQYDYVENLCAFI